MSGLTSRVVQATAWYAPYDVGGTEIYLDGLVAGLEKLGISSSVLVPRHKQAPATYRHGFAEIETYPVGAEPSRAELRGERPHDGFEEFVSRLKAHTGAIYHQHSWTRGCGPHHLKIASDLGFKTVVTVHVASNVCLRGTMLLNGARPCDGCVEDVRCGACWAASRGSPEMLTCTIARLPIGIAGWASKAKGRWATALSARAHARLKVLQIREMILRADRIVVVCQWLHDALLANGAPPKKLVLSRQGVSPTFLEATKSARPPKARLADETLRLLYVGRWDRAKGIDVAVRAVRRLPLHVDVQMVILAAPGAADGGAYEREVRTLALADPRISVAGPVSRDELPNVLADYDALVVPSLVLETGPLVVLEAQAAGLLVLGSRLGGIAELLESDPASELVDAGNVEAWTTSILNLWHHRRERVFKRPPVSMRTMEHVATEMGSLYREL